MKTPWPEVLNGRAFREWLLGIGSGGQISQGQRLDPFATSMRNFAHAAEWMALARERKSLPERGGSGVQAATDLRSARLLSQDDSLTALGQRSLDRWEQQGVADSSTDHELLRCAVIVTEAIAVQEPAYLEMLAFWRQVREAFEATKVLEDRALLFFPSYLNQGVNGYNPWEIIARMRLSMAGATPDSLVECAQNGPDPNKDVMAAAENIQRRIVDWSTRAEGRRTFCSAMELYVLAQQGVAQAEAALNEMNARFAA
ncbi:MAG TPA: hypothetical protein VGR71_11135 [Nitrospira sp.]|nr:hypothetical protein [Nitrospira sp.]